VGDLPGQPRARQALTARPIPVAATSSPTCLPLGPLNTLVIAPGIVSGTAAPTPGRTSFEAKSPLTGGIKETNAGGLSWQQIASLGIKAIVVEGQPTVTDACYLLRVTKDGYGEKIFWECPAMVVLEFLRYRLIPLPNRSIHCRQPSTIFRASG